MKAGSRCFLAGCLALLFLGSMLVSARAQEKKPLKIGAIFSTTGRATSLGAPEKNTVLMLTQQVNSTGGINGYPLEVIIENDQTLDSGAKVAAQKLINADRVLAILGPSISGSSLVVKPVCESAKVPLVSCAAAEAIVKPIAESRFIFKTAQMDSHAVLRILEQIKHMGIGKIALLVEKSAYGTEGAKKLLEFAPGLGLEIVADETFNVNDVNMTDQLTVARNAGAGAVVTWGLVPNQTIVARNMHAMRWKAPLFYSHSFGNPKAIKTAGSVVDGALFPTGRLLVVDLLPKSHFHKSVLTAYKNAYEKQYGPVSTFGGYAYDAFWIVVNAMKAKNINPDMSVAEARKLIRDGIEATHGWIGVTGEFNMSADDHLGLDKERSLEMCVVKHGEITPMMSATASK